MAEDRTSSPSPYRDSGERTSPLPIRIHTQGFVPEDLYIDGVHDMCGDIEDGIGIHFGDRAGGVMSWTDFEAAYLAVKALREKSNAHG